MKTQFAALFASHAAFIAYAVLAGAVVRLLKDDTKLPTLPKRWRPWLSVAFGAVALVADRLAGGASWRDAAVHGFMVGVLPVFGHEAIVESILARFGITDVPLPSVLLKQDDGGGPSGPSAVADVAKSVGAGLVALLFGLAVGAFTTSACTGQQAQPKTPQEQARKDIAVLSISIQLATNTCTAGGKAMRAAGNAEGQHVLEVCADAYDYARKSLEAAEKLVDAWDDQAQGRVFCMAAHALDALDRINAMVIGHAIKVDKETATKIDEGVRTGIALASYAGGDCLAPSPPKDAGPETDAADAAETSAIDAQEGGADGHD